MCCCKKSEEGEITSSWNNRKLLPTQLTVMGLAELYESTKKKKKENTSYAKEIAQVKVQGKYRSLSRKARTSSFKSQPYNSPDL